MTEIENWFYSGDNDIFVKSSIESRSKPLNDLGGKVYKRFYDWGKLSESLAMYENIINTNLQQYNQKYESFVKGTSNLTQNDCDEITKLISTHNTQLNEYMKQFTSYPKCMDIPISHENVTKASEDFTKVKI